MTGKKLRELRKAKGLAQWKLAEMVDCTQTQISRIERGTAKGKLRDRVEWWLTGKMPEKGVTLTKEMMVRGKWKGIGDPVPDNAIIFNKVEDTARSSSTEVVRHDGSIYKISSSLAMAPELTITPEVTVKKRPHPKAGTWIPKNAETYYYVTDDGGVNADTWSLMGRDIFRLSRGNVFKTAEDALKSMGL